MASLTEQLQEESKKKTEETIKIADKSAKAMKKGIALILNATVLSEDTVMRALDKKIDKSGDLSYSYANVSLDELQKTGKIEKIDTPMLKESMRYFDKYCREYGVKYSALKQIGEKENGYIIFFEGKNDKIIEEIIKRACDDWTKDQQNEKMAGQEMSKSADKDNEKPSVLAKLAFFRNRVKEFVDVDKNKDTQNQKDKNRSREAEMDR